MAKSTTRGKTFRQLLDLLDGKAAEKRPFNAPQQTVEVALQCAFPGLEDDVQLLLFIAAEYNTAATVPGGCVATVARAHNSISSPSCAVRMSSAPLPSCS